MSQLSIDFGMSTTSSFDDDGHPQVGIDLPGGSDEGKQGGAAPAEQLSVFGLLSRPLDPVRDPAGHISVGCGLLWIRNGDERHAFLMEDPRVIELLPRLKKGGSMLYCASGSFVLFDGEDPNGEKQPGSLTASVKYAGGQKAHVLAMDKRTEGKEQISLLHGEGQGLVMVATGKKSAVLKNRNGTAWVETNDDGVVLAGKTKVQGSLTVGDQAAAQPLAIAPTVAAALSAINETIVAVAAAAVAGGFAAGCGPAAALLAPKLTPLLTQMEAKHLKAT